MAPARKRFATPDVARGGQREQRRTTEPSAALRVSFAPAACRRSPLPIKRYYIGQNELPNPPRQRAGSRKPVVRRLGRAPRRRRLAPQPGAHLRQLPQQLLLGARRDMRAIARQPRRPRRPQAALGRPPQLALLQPPDPLLARPRLALPRL